MFRMFVCLTTIFGLAAAHAVNTEKVPSARLYYGVEAETALESSILGTAVSKVSKVAWLFLYSLWSIAEYKFALVGFGIKTALWFTRHSFSLLVGAGLMFVFCKITGFCGQHYIPDGILQIVPSDHLAEAERTFNDAMATYYENN